MKKKRNYVYMKVTRDRFELPIAIADTVVELAAMCGVSQTTVSGAICHAKQNNAKSVYKKVNIGR